MDKLCEFAYTNHELNKVFGEIFSNNITCLSFIKKTEFQCEAKLKKHKIIKNNWIDVYIYSRFLEKFD
ncbi:GNAT family N-acetyltransferase [Nosocomiicoccus sp. HMSC059G07]|uniref:GNAT family N-acetyltransferase n=1 Tax=Nosocomiicoccus sp. HMSC059G07 TaxID=1739531 RepID=UPI00352B4942